MSTLFKRYEQLGEQTIKFSLYFDRNTIDWATSRPKSIGYFVSAFPVTITQKDGYSIEESGCFTGFKTCLLPVGRQSKKRLEEAIATLDKNMEQYLNHFKNK